MYPVHVPQLPNKMDFHCHIYPAMYVHVNVVHVRVHVYMYTHT